MNNTERDERERGRKMTTSEEQEFTSPSSVELGEKERRRRERGKEVYFPRNMHMYDYPNQPDQTRPDQTNNRIRREQSTWSQKNPELSMANKLDKVIIIIIIVIVITITILFLAVLFRSVHPTPTKTSQIIVIVNIRKVLTIFSFPPIIND